MNIDYLRDNFKLPLLHLEKAEKQALDFDGDWWLVGKAAFAELKPGFLIGLLGKKGVGKTQFAAMYALTNLKEGQKYGRYAYLTAMRFYMTLKGCYHKDSEMTEQEVMDYFRDIPLLILDEMHVRSGSEWEDNMLITLIDERYSHQKDTIIISNLTPEAFEQSLGAAIVSRMVETGNILVCGWESFRDRQK